MDCAAICIWKLAFRARALNNVTAAATGDARPGLRGSRFGEAYERFLKANSLRDIWLEEGFFDSARDRDAGRKVAL